MLHARTNTGIYGADQETIRRGCGSAKKRLLIKKKHRAEQTVVPLMALRCGDFPIGGPTRRRWTNLLGQIIAQFCNLQILNFCANSELCASSEFSSALQGKDYRHSSISGILCAMRQETQSVVSPNEERPKSKAT